MEIPVISRITHKLETAAITSSLPSTTLFSQILTTSFLSDAAHNFWTWSAIIVALVATFSGVVNQIKVLIYTFYQKRHPLSDPIYSDIDEDDKSFSDQDFTDGSSDGWSEDEEDDEPTSTSGKWEETDRYFNVKGGSSRYSDDQWQNGHPGLRRSHFSWSDFATGRKSVVKLWENIRLGFQFDECYGNEISVYDVNKEKKISSVFAGMNPIAAVPWSSATVLSAESDLDDVVSLKLWDTRVGSSPATIAEWKPWLGKIVGVRSGGVEKFYVRNDVTGELAVGDTRNVRSPLTHLKEADVRYYAVAR